MIKHCVQKEMNCLMPDQYAGCESLDKEQRNSLVQCAEVQSGDCSSSRLRLVAGIDHLGPVGQEKKDHLRGYVITYPPLCYSFQQYVWTSNKTYKTLRRKTDSATAAPLLCI